MLNFSQTTIDMMDEYVTAHLASRQVTGMMGRPDNAGGWEFYAVGQIGQVYVRMWQGNSVTVHTATNLGQVPLNQNLRVIMERINGELCILWPEPSSFRQIYGNYANYAGAVLDYVQTVTGQGSHLSSFQAYPQDSTSLTLVVAGGWYRGLNRFPGVNDNTLTLVPTATADSVAWIVVTSDLTTGALTQTLDSTDRPLTYTILEANLPDITAIALPANSLPVCAVLLANGATNFTSHDIVPLDMYPYEPLTLAQGAAVTRTIASGVLTTGLESTITIAPESGTSDDLTQIVLTGEPRLLVLKADSGKTITLKHAASNLFFNAANDVVISGNQHLILTHDGTNASDLTSIALTATVNTTNNTVTTLASIATASSVSYTVTAYVTARRTGGSAGTAGDSAGYKLWGAFKNIAGTLSQIGTTDKVAAKDQAGWDANFDVTGTTIRVRVTGETNNNISWLTSYQIQAV